MPHEVEEDSEGEEVDGDFEGIDGERILLPREEEVMRKIGDPKLRSEG